MFTAKKIFPFFILIILAFCLADCKKKTTTEAEFINQQLLRTGTDTRVNALEDLLHFSALQSLNACQEDCEKLKQKVELTRKDVIALEELLAGRGGKTPPPPPNPCPAGNCRWTRLGLFSYFADMKKFGNLPKVSIQTLNGEVISSSDQAEIKYSPDGGQFALVSLPQVEFNDKAVKMVIDAGNGPAEILVNIK